MLKLPLKTIRNTNNSRRFMRLIGAADRNGCWNWKGHVKARGYGTFGVKISRGKWITTALAHRVSYILFVGKIPDGLTLDHLCRNRNCVNPAHLEPVTSKINSLRGQSFAANNARKTNCPKGHPLSGYNLKFDRRPNGKVARRCRKCANAAVAKHYIKYLKGKAGKIIWTK